MGGVSKKEKSENSSHLLELNHNYQRKAPYGVGERTMLERFMLSL